MSAIIGICSTNFCSFISDKRKTTNQNENWVVSNDDTPKIFKIHDELLFGATGLFFANECIDDAIKPLLEDQDISLKAAVQNILNFLEKRKYKMPKMRNYLLGGKDEDGQYCMYLIHMNFETYSPEITFFQPQLPTANYAIALSLPPETMQYQNQYFNSVNHAIQTSKTVEQMLGKTAGIIREISKVSSTVSQDTMTLSLLG